MHSYSKNSDSYKYLTETPVHLLILRLSVPTIISMLTTSIYNMVDTAFVGRLGTSASGAVGIVFGYMAIIQAFGFTFGQGCGSMSSRFLGAKQNEEANGAASAGFFSSLLTGFVISLLSLLFINKLVYVLGSTVTIAPYAKSYLMYIIFSAPLMTASLTLNNILRYEGKAAFGMAGMLTGSLLNICGDAILMFGFNMGISGAGLSTAISQSISFVILICPFLMKRTSCCISFGRFICCFVKIPEIFATGLPSLIRQGLTSLSTIILNFCASFYGDYAVAAMSIASRVVYFIYSFVIGIGQGYQPVSAFNYGAKKFDRLKSGYRVTIILSEITVTIISLLVVIFSAKLVQLFRDDPDVIVIGSRALRLQALSLILLPLSSVTELQLQSTGQKLAASLLSSLRSGLIFIPVLLILANLRGLAGIQEAQAISNILVVIPALYFLQWFFNKIKQEQ